MLKSLDPPLESLADWLKRRRNRALHRARWAGTVSGNRSRPRAVQEGLIAAAAVRRQRQREKGLDHAIRQMVGYHPLEREMNREPLED